jgi:hypothetical protein
MVPEKWSPQWGLNPPPLSNESSALTTRPWLLAKSFILSFFFLSFLGRLCHFCTKNVFLQFLRSLFGSFFSCSFPSFECLTVFLSVSLSLFSMYNNLLCNFFLSLLS